MQVIIPWHAQEIHLSTTSSLHHPRCYLDGDYENGAEERISEEGSSEESSQTENGKTERVVVERVAREESGKPKMEVVKRDKIIGDESCFMTWMEERVPFMKSKGDNTNKTVMTIVAEPEWCRQGGDSYEANHSSYASLKPYRLEINPYSHPGLYMGLLPNDNEDFCIS